MGIRIFIILILSHFLAAPLLAAEVTASNCSTKKLMRDYFNKNEPPAIWKQTINRLVNKVDEADGCLCENPAQLTQVPENRQAPANQSTMTPAWMKQYTGESENQINATVLQRARQHYLQQKAEGAVKNPCYMAFDATKPHLRGDGSPANRYYIICEELNVFIPVSSGHGSGRKLMSTSFKNDKDCTRVFSNSLNSNSTMGGRFVTKPSVESYKGIERDDQGTVAGDVYRSFIPFHGVDPENSNSLQRDIGGHPAILLNEKCKTAATSIDRMENRVIGDFVPNGAIVDYSAGRSQGCTNWSPATAEVIVQMVRDNPTTLYIYPQEADVLKVEAAVAAGRTPAEAGTYWNSKCLSTVGYPVYLGRDKPFFLDPQFFPSRLAALEAAGVPKDKILKLDIPELNSTFDSNVELMKRTWQMMINGETGPEPDPNAPRGPAKAYAESKEMCPETKSEPIAETVDASIRRAQ